MFGGGLTVPVPDVDRTDFLLDARRQPVRVQRQPAPPRRTGRAGSRRCRPAAAGWWWSTRAGAAPPRRPTSGWPSGPAPTRSCSPRMVQALADEGLVDLGASRAHVDGLDEASRRSPPFTPEAVAAAAASTPATIRALARELAARRARRVYGRIGTTTAEFGTIASWLVDVLNVLHRQPRPARRGDVHAGRGRRGEHPRHAAARAGRAPRPQAQPGARAARVFRRAARRCAWPRRSTRRARARSGRWSPSPATRCCPRRTPTGSTRALAGARVHGEPSTSTVNETTRHADVILPAPSPLQKGHYDIALLQLAVRNVANYSPPVLPLEPTASSTSGRCWPGWR